jgi:ribosomal protein S18 acetylase RimI-like enzyme
MIRFEHILIGGSLFKDEYCCNIYNWDGRVGYCKYYRRELDYNSVYIEYINIYEEHRRKGYATAMVKELQSKYTLLWEYSFTQTGRKWFNKLVKREIVKPQDSEFFKMVTD